MFYFYLKVLKVESRRMRCAPGREKYEGCLLESELRMIAEAYIELYPKSDLDISKPLFSQLERLLSDKCKDSRDSRDSKCWIESDPLIRVLLESKLEYILSDIVYKPCIHEDRYAWLSTTDINMIMMQYMQANVSFGYLGTFPSDVLDLISMDELLETYRDFTKKGMILNLDPHTKGGIHWVAVYIDSKDETIEYFDSLDEYPTPAIKGVLRYLKGHDLFKGYKLYNTSVKFQLKNSECGVYCIYYILNRVLNRSFNDIQSDVIRDDEMNEYRDILYDSTCVKRLVKE